jgi:hypothetical protein
MKKFPRMRKGKAVISADMISTVYIEQANQRLDLELKIISHFLLHPREREARNAFITKEANSQ